MTLIRRRSARRLYASFLLIALLAGVLTALAVRFGMDPYRLESIPYGPITRGKETIFPLPIDLDDDGRSEIVRLRNRPERYSFEVQVMPSLDSSQVILSVNQFSEPVSVRLLNALDLNGDGVKELIQFTVGTDPIAFKDTLFLYVKDVAAGKLLANRLPVVSRHDFSSKVPWNILEIPSTGLDINDDGFKEIFFGMAPGNDNSARGVYCVDLKVPAVVRRRTMGAKVSRTFEVGDIDGDTRPEILFATSATNNAPNAALFPDSISWLIAMTTDFAVVPLTRSFGNQSGSLNLFRPANPKGDTWVVVHHESNPPGKTVFVLDDRLQIKRQQSFVGLADLAIQLDDRGTAPIEVFGVVTSDSLFALDCDLNLLAAYPYASGNSTRVFRVFPWSERHLLFEMDSERTSISDFLTGERIASSEDVLYGAQMYSLMRSGSADRGWIANIRGERNALLRLVPTAAHGAWGLAGLSGFLATFLLLGGIHQAWEWVAIQRDYRRFLNRPEAGPLLVIDEKDTLIAISQRFCDLLDAREADLVNRPWREALAGAPEVCRVIDASLEAIPDAPVPLTSLLAGRPIVAELRMSAFHSAWRVRYHFVFYLRDHTEAVQAERLRAWSSTVRRLTHDIKTPLASIILSLDTLQRELPPGDGEVQEDLALIKGELERLSTITRGFQQFADLEKPRPEVLDLRDWIARSLEHFAAFRTDGMDMVVDVGEDADLVWADGRQVMLILHILVENAIDAMEGEGTVRVRTRLENRDGEPGEGCIAIEVADTGPGIAAERTERVFDPHYTTKPHGTGMGLAFARKLAADNGGEIVLDGAAPEGALFRVLLPRVRR